MKRYFAYGLCINSDLVLPLLPLREYLDRSGTDQLFAPDITIRVDYDKRVYQAPGHNQKSLWEITRDRAVLTVKDVATFYISRGKEVVIYPALPVDEKKLVLIVINSILAILLYQRKLLVMHASCIQLDKFSVAFMGHSGSGKSLLAGALCAKGHGLVTDDISALDVEHTPVVRPGYPMIKMVSNDSRRLGLSGRNRVLLHEKHRKFGCGFNDSFILQPDPLRYIFILHIGEERSIEKLSAREAFIYLIENTAPQIWLLPPDDTHFAHLEKLLHDVIVCRFTREKNAAHVSDHAKIIKDYCCA